MLRNQGQQLKEYVVSRSGVCAMELPGEHSEAFLDAAPDAMVILDAAGKIVFVNIQAEAMFEHSRGELKGQPVEVLLPERFRERHRDHLLRYCVAPRSRPMGAGLELVARRKHGAEFPVEISLSPVLTGDGTFVSAAIRDITSRKLVEQQLIAARESAEQANRAKSAFLAAVSHDLRQPLQTLSLLSNVLRRVVPTDSKAAMAVANQSEALDVMVELVNALLDIGKLEAGAVTPDITDCTVSSLFSRLRSEFAALAAAKGIELIVEDCNDVVRTDPTLLRRIIQNLLGNAIRYTQHGWVRLRALASLEVVRIEVLDTGIGIAPEELDRIFDEYYQASHKSGQGREGVGLGLAIARRVANLLGCAVEVNSTLDKGSCFSVSVPRAAASSQIPMPVTAPTVTVAPKGALVLIIDDDVSVADATAMLFRSIGVEVMSATDVGQALERIAAHGRQPDLLICDYHLGEGESGVQAIARCREAAQQQLPAIVISGDTGSAVASTVRGIDGCYLLSKPVDVDELIELSAGLLQQGAPFR